MQQNHTGSNDNNDDKNLDPYNALEKVIRLDKKHTNFDYYDKERNVGFRVNYPIPPFEAPNNQHLLKGFWRHINNYYFKKIEQSELERLDYLQALMVPLNQCNFVTIKGNVRFSGSVQFWYTVQRIFSESYLNRFKNSEIDHVDCKNWLQILFLTWQKTQLKDKNKKKIESELNKVSNCFGNLQNFHKIEDTKKRFEKLKIEEKQISKLLPPQDDDDEISRQIRKYQRQLETECSLNSDLLQKLKERVRFQLDSQEIAIIKHREEEALEKSDDITADNEVNDKIVKIKRKVEKMETVQVIQNYLEYCIKNLEKKQIAESISKISHLHKGKQKEENIFEIEFQTGMNIKKIQMPEKKMLQLNQLRQYNLFKFYNTSLKTPYSFICQNYLGFRWIYENRNQPCALKDKNILQEMKKTKTDFPQSKAAKQMQKFDICHHCKLIYPETYLVKCNYNSSKNGAPITPSSYYDPYVSQIIKLQQPKLSNRFMGRKRNCYLSYTKKNEQYVCDRKFCRYCLRQNYDDGLDKNGLCPFCQGVCFCTRCARNDMIVRLKSMLLLLGGDIQKIQDQSEMEKIIKGQVQMLSPNVRNGSRSKSRPPKKPIGGAPARLNQKMRNIRYQLQDLRILCDLVKRREKQKQKLVEIRCDLFTKKVAAIGKDLNIKALNESSINTLIEEQQEQQQKKIKFQKKLGRMI